MEAARRHGPLRLTRLPDLGGEQRALYLAMKREATNPTVRLATAGWALLLTSAVSLAVGIYIGRTI